VVPLTVEQVRALADAMAARYRALVIAQAGLGLRIGELFALRVADVDFLRRTVRVQDQIDQKTGSAGHRNALRGSMGSSARTAPQVQISHRERHPVNVTGI
jgi:integrase